MAKETGGARARITVKVQPRARATRLAGQMENAYRLQLAAPPVDGKANEACVAFLAELAGVAKSRVRIVSGATARMKVVEIEGIAQGEMERRMEEAAGDEFSREPREARAWAPWPATRGGNGRSAGWGRRLRRFDSPCR